MIIDIHTHVFPDDLAARAIQHLTYGNTIPVYSDGTCDGLTASMTKAGIDFSVIMPIATKPSQVKGINQWAVEVNQKYKNLHCFGTLHPLMDNWEEEIEYLVSVGIRGIKLHPDYQSFFVDEPEMMMKYQHIADSGLILMLHAGIDIGLPEPVHCMPDRLAKMLDVVQGLKVIAAHMGGYKCWDDVERHLVGKNVYFDTSYSLMDMGPEQMVSLIQTHGADKVMFGTDSPWTDTKVEVDEFKALPLDDDELDAVMGGNAEKLLWKHAD